MNNALKAGAFFLIFAFMTFQAVSVVPQLMERVTVDAVAYMDRTNWASYPAFIAAGIVLSILAISEPLHAFLVKIGVYKQ